MPPQKGEPYTREADSLPYRTGTDGANPRADEGIGPYEAGTDGAKSNRAAGAP